jgi:anti-anti-sigma regulatory factor
VIQLGQACLQVMLSARATASERGRTLAVSRPSEAMRTMMTLAGCADLAAATEN